MPGAPKKSNPTQAKTAQTGMYEKLDAVDPSYVTPKKMDKREPDQPEEYSPASSVDLSEPTKDEIEVGSMQEKFSKSLMSARGRKRKTKHSKKTAKKTRKVKKTKKTKKTRKH